MQNVYDDGSFQIVLVAPATLSSLCSVGRASGISLAEGVGGVMSVSEQWQMLKEILLLFPIVI